MRFIIGLLLLAGCAAQQSAPTPDTCDAARFAPMVGGPVTALERVYMLGKIRIQRPGHMFTQDFDPARVNVHVGKDGSITHLTCG